MSLMYIRKLVFRGENLKDAILDFYPGFNSVTGASDSGKSLVVSLIQFALGADFPVEKLPEEANGYENVFLEIVASEKAYTLFRKISSPESILVYELPYEQITEHNISSYHEYSLAHNAKDSKNFSRFMLKIIECPYKNLVCEDGKNEGFTFTKWLRLVVLDESRVYTDRSVIYSTSSKNDYSNKGARAAFYAIIRGQDDKPAEKKTDLKISKARLEGQLDQLVEIIEALKSRIEVTQKDLDGWRPEIIETEIQNLEAIIAQLESELKSENDLYAEKAMAVNALIEQKDRVHHTIIRMELLLKNLRSDAKRLDFIEEANGLAEQLVELECPLCHGIIEGKHSVKPLEDFWAASLKEREKLQKQIFDLSETIKSFSIDLESIEAQMRTLQTEQDAISNRIKKLVQKRISDAWNDLEKYKKLRDLVHEVESIMQQIEEYTEKKTRLETEIRATQKKVSESRRPLLIDTGKLQEFCLFVERYLHAWGFGNERVYFTVSQDDVRIGTKEKMSHGKGARALINSAFILGLLDYSISKGLSHPGFVLLDSPIIAYKEKDVTYVDTEVPIEVKSLFYATLKKAQSDRQIIVIENVEPEGANKEQNLHHFSGNPRVYRQGFIPLKEV